MAALVTAALGCASSHTPEPGDAGRAAAPDACVLCGCPGPGAYHSAPYDAEEGDRAFFLYVPSTQRCDGALSLWVDLHATTPTWSAERVPPEEDELLDDLVALAEREGLVLLRPRAALHARTPSSEGAGEPWYSWSHPTTGETLGDEVAFLGRLVTAVRSSTRAGAALYLTGVRATPAVIAPLLTGSEALRPDGIAVLGTRLVPWEGGDGARAWSDERWLDTRSREPLPTYRASLESALGTSSLRIVEARTGHTRGRGWEYEDALAWLVHGEPVPAPSARASWTVASVASDVSLLGLVESAEGRLLAVGSDRRTFVEDDEGEWLELPRADVSDRGRPGTLLDACQLIGAELVVTDGRMVQRFDGSRFVANSSDERWSGPLLSLVCTSDGLLLRYQHPGVLVSRDAGRSWDIWSEPVGIGDVEDLAASPVTGTVVVAGASLRAGARGALTSLGAAARAERRPDRSLFERAALPADAQPIHAVDCGPDGTWWMAGENGSVYRSTDDGRTFERLARTTPHALYAVQGRADGSVVAVGAYGTVVVSRDGRTLEDVSTGFAGMLAAVRSLDDGRVVVAGEAGTIAYASSL